MSQSIADSPSVDTAEYPYDPQPPLLPFDAEAHAKSLAKLRSVRRGWILAVALTVVFCLVDLTIVPLMEFITGPDDFCILPIFILIPLSEAPCLERPTRTSSDESCADPANE